MNSNFLFSKAKVDEMAGPAVKFSETKPSIRRKPPLHGEHTSEVLQELGIGIGEQKRLSEQGVI